jgi:hypothetical protein
MEQRTISRMTQKPIRLSALGRDVKVGDLYNYKNDLILKSKLFFVKFKLFCFTCNSPIADLECIFFMRPWLNP